MQRFRYSTLLLALLSVLITSCGDDTTMDGLSSGGQDEIDGLWGGSVIDSGITHPSVLGLSDSDGDLNIILNPSGGNNASLAGIAIFFDGEVDTNSNSSEMTLYDISGGFVEELKFVQGALTFDPAPPDISILDAELNNDAETRPVRLILTYNSFLYERPSSLALVSGTWRFDDGLNTLDLEIDANGVLTGDDNDGCLYTGDVTTLKEDRNLYRISVEIACPQVPIIATSGLATLKDVFAPDDTLIYSVTGIDTLQSESVAFVESLTRQ